MRAALALTVGCDALFADSVKRSPLNAQYLHPEIRVRPSFLSTTTECRSMSIRRSRTKSYARAREARRFSGTKQPSTFFLVKDVLGE